MKIGTPNNPRLPPEEEIAWAARNGFEFLDLSLEPDLCLPERIDPRSIRAALDKHGIGVVGHMAWFLPIGSPLPSLRQAGVEAAAAAVRAFGRIDIPTGTIHTHWPSHLFTIEEGIAFQVESLKALVLIARESGVTLMLEPAASWCDVPDHIEAILQNVPELALHLDLGHCNLNGFKPPHWIRRFAAKTFHVHAHDNNGREDAHLPPGTGSVDWKDTILALKDTGYDGTITIESFSAEREYRCLGRDLFRKLWNSL